MIAMVDDDDDDDARPPSNQRNLDELVNSTSAAVISEIMRVRGECERKGERKDHFPMSIREITLFTRRQRSKKLIYQMEIDTLFTFQKRRERKRDGEQHY